MHTPQYLQPGAKIGIIAPARKVKNEEIEFGMKQMWDCGNSIPIIMDKELKEYFVKSHTASGDIHITVQEKVEFVSEKINMSLVGS